MDKGETHIKVNEPTFPGKIWKLNNPQAFKVLEMGSGTVTRPGSSATVTKKQVAERGDAQNGRQRLHSGSTGSSASLWNSLHNAADASEFSSKRFGETYRDIQNALGETGTRVLELYQQYNPRGKEFIALGPKDGQMVAMVLRFPLDLIRKGLKVTVTAIDTSDIKRRTNSHTNPRNAATHAVLSELHADAQLRRKPANAA
jgi:hypothetical protein